MSPPITFASVWWADEEDRAVQVIIREKVQGGEEARMTW